MAKTKSGTIVVFAAPKATQETRLLGKRSGATEVPIDTLKQNLQKFVSSLSDVLPAAAAASTSDIRLTSFDVAVGVNASGEVGFLGTGVQVGAHATLTLRFER